MTHLLFKITRARALRELKEDCFASDKDKISPSRAALMDKVATELEAAGRVNPKFQRRSGHQTTKTKTAEGRPAVPGYGVRYPPHT